MRFICIIALLGCSIVAIPSGARPQSETVSYEPTVVTLEGIIIREKFPHDGSHLDRGHYAWILRLDHPVTVVGTPDADLNTTETNVTEIHLNAEPDEHQIPKSAFGKKRFSVTGTLYHSHTVHHLRPIMMFVTDLRPTEGAVPR